MRTTIRIDGGAHRGPAPRRSAAPRRIVSAQGAWLEDAEGDVFLDAATLRSGALHGHGHPACAIDNPTVRTKDGRRAAASVAARIDAIAPGEMRCAAIGPDATLERALAMATAGREDQPIVPAARTGLTGLEAVLKASAGRVGAVVIEPLIATAVQMWIRPRGELAEIRRLCDEWQVPLVCDETATGLGRTGTLLACEQEGVAPDLLRVGPSLTGGLRPFGAIIAARERISGAEGVMEADPVGCEAAAITLDAFASDDTIAQIQPKIHLLSDLLETLAELPAVVDVRQRGLLAGVELEDEQGAVEAQHLALAEGLLVDRDGPVLGLSPTLTISGPELRRLAESLARAVSRAEPRLRAAS
ncbi:MAG: aminotransferase class III-fold pyridoxal phosphate-dependent enzyme [Solirubrobacterales bacterium]